MLRNSLQEHLGRKYVSNVEASTKGRKGREARPAAMGWWGACIGEFSEAGEAEMSQWIGELIVKE